MIRAGMRSCKIVAGTAGAGKSWFAQAVSKRRKVTIVSQDDTRSRSACESQLGRSANMGLLTILDRQAFAFVTFSLMV